MMVDNYRQLLLFTHQILAIIADSAALETFDVLQVAAEGGNAVGFQTTAGYLAQTGVDGGGREPLALSLVADSGVIFVEVLDGRGLDLKLAVVGNQLLDFLGCHPVLFALLGDDGVGLVVEGGVVGLVIGIDGGRQLNAYETAVAGGVAQHAGFVAGSDERGHTGEVLNMLTIGTLDLHPRQLDDVLEEALLSLGAYLVELVETDYQEVMHGLECLLLFLDDEVLEESPLQLAGQEVAAEERLAVALRRNEQRDERVAIVAHTAEL